MSSQKNNFFSLFIRNGLKALSLLIVGVISLVSIACGTSKSTVENENNPPPKNTIRQEIIDVARTQLGKPYLYAGASPNGYDCSGFSYYVMKQKNISLKRTSEQQARQGKHVNLKKAREADLIFFGSNSKVTHVGIITSNKNGRLVMIHSSSSNGIVEEEISNSEYWQKRLLFAKDILN